MTTLQDKTPEELNTICAELCGWHHFGCTGCACTPCRCNQWIRADDGPCELPPYATSYDAIFGEVKKLDGPTLAVLYRKLYWMLIPEEDQYENHFITFPMVATMATASPADLTRALILVLQSK